MKKVLVTGANGFIGKNLIIKLLSEDKVVYGIVHPENNSLCKIVNKRLHIKCIDLNHLFDYIQDFPFGEIDTLYHFAWIGVKPELRKDLDVQIKNINMTLDCMKLAKALGIKKVVFPGSTNEYLYYGKPINKEAIPSPCNAYGATKVALRYLCNDFALRNNIEFIYAIITGIYGPERRDNNVIFYTINKLLRKEKPSLTPLEQLWDYIYIDDAIDALFQIGEYGKGGAIYAVGHGDNWALSNYIKIIHNIINPSLPLGIGEVPYTNNKIPSSCIDLSDIKKDTDFIPKIDFETGISRVISELKKDIEAN